jgi:dUTP pyrophosphatase
MQLKIKLIEGGRLPEKANPNAACYDVFAREVVCRANGKIACLLGFETEIPTGYKAHVIPRSGLSNFDWVLTNSIGCIDEDYRGEWQARFSPLTVIPQGPFKPFQTSFPYSKGDRVAQIYFEKVLPVEFIVTDQLIDTARGKGGFHSTGTKEFNGFKSIEKTDMGCTHECKCKNHNT